MHNNDFCHGKHPLQHRRGRCRLLWLLVLQSEKGEEKRGKERYFLLYSTLFLLLPFISSMRKTHKEKKGAFRWLSLSPQLKEREPYLLSLLLLSPFFPSLKPNHVEEFVCLAHPPRVFFFFSSSFFLFLPTNSWHSSLTLGYSSVYKTNKPRADRQTDRQTNPGKSKVEERKRQTALRNCWVR